MPLSAGSVDELGSRELRHKKLELAGNYVINTQGGI